MDLALMNTAVLLNTQIRSISREIYFMSEKHGSVLNVGTVMETKEEIAPKSQRKAFWIKLVVATCIGQQMK